jgi:hypothetical protein
MRTNTRLLAVAVLAGALAVPLGAAAETPARERPPHHDATVRTHDGMRLDCKAMHRQDRAAVGCQWTPTKMREFASYRLVRHERGRRDATIVATSQGRNATRAVDATVTRDREYLYFAQALDSQGRVIDSSNPVRVSTRTRPEPAPAPLPGRPSLPELPSPPSPPQPPSPPGL